MNYPPSSGMPTRQSERSYTKVSSLQLQQARYITVKRSLKVKRNLRSLHTPSHPTLFSLPPSRFGFELLFLLFIFICHLYLFFIPAAGKVGYWLLFSQYPSLGFRIDSQFKSSCQVSLTRVTAELHRLLRNYFSNLGN